MFVPTSMAAPRERRYEVVPAALSYHYKYGVLYDLTWAPVVPARARPGWVQLENMVMAAASPTAHPQHNPKWRYIEEVTMHPPDNAHPDNWLDFSLVEGSDIS